MAVPPPETGEGPPPPERVLLSLLERWRSALARNAALRNPGLRSWELDASVHAIINRCLYLRICSDRGLIPPGTLRDLAPLPGLEERLASLFRDADGPTPLALSGCNGEGGRGSSREGPVLDDGVLRGFLEAISPPELPCDFRTVPLTRLAGMYRVFLRKEIRLLGGHRAVLEETVAARGAGGYPPPPEAAREYLVARALGERRIRDETYRVQLLDPACGTGHLLILACRHLVNRHGSGPREGEFPDLLGRFRCLGVLHGVDPDPRAVEVTRMLLLLSALEGGEGHQGIESGRDPVLPGCALGDQIRCGNAVVGPEYLEERYPPPAPRRVRELGSPVDWHAAFPAVMGSGGFDVVMAEPPTHRPGTEQGLRRYLQQHYQAYHDEADMAVYLMERGLSLTSREGTFASLTPDRWLRARYAGPLRKLLSARQMEEIVLVAPGAGKAATGTGHCILRVNPGPAGRGIRVLRVDPEALASLAASTVPGGFVMDPGSLGEGGWTLAVHGSRELRERLKGISSPLARYVVGTLPSGAPAARDDRSLVDLRTRDRLIREDGRNAEEFLPVVLAEQVGRYGPVAPERFLEGGPGIAPCSGAILCTEHAGAPACSLETSGALAGSGIILIPRGDLYLLGILNSSLSRFLFREGGGKLSVRWLEQFPVYVPDFSLLDDTARHDRVEALVSRMLELHARMRIMASDDAKRALRRQIDATDREIDELVYGLYGLTAEERSIVEGATR